MRASLVLLSMLLFSACAGAPSSPDPGPSLSPTPDSTPFPGLSPSRSWNDEEASAAMFRLLRFDADEALSVIDFAGSARDRRLIAPLIDLLRFYLSDQLDVAIARSLASITDESFHADWGDWMEWLGRQDGVPLTDGYATWKGELLAGRADEEFRRFLDSSRPSTIRVELIQWGGVAVDGIPALSDPRHVPASEASYLTPKDLVFGVQLNGDARAYPLRILDWHEMANDVVGGVPVSLAYCTLCGAGVLYETTVDGTVYDFGSSGLLYESNKLMYDRQTDTLWNQLTGEPVNGPLVGSGIALRRLPIVVTDWASWRAEHPDTIVLDIDTGYTRGYTPGAPYGDYFASPDTMFPVYQRSKALPTKAFIFALVIDGTPKAYPLERLRDQQVTNDVLAGRAVVLVSNPATRAVRAYERGSITFSPAAEPQQLTDAAGHTWRVTEDVLLGPDGQSLARLPGHLAYWFGWFSFYPQTLLYGNQQ